MAEKDQPDLGRYDAEMLKFWLGKMLLIRRFEEKAGQMYGLRKIGGFCHLYIGQEAVCCGAVANLDLTHDYVMTAYRDHGHALACGMEPKVVMAELYGKITGCSRGKGGSMHLFDVEKHFLGGHGIVGAHLPLAAGVALKLRYYEEKGVVLCFFGDGAIHQGTFHETLNMARIWDLPVLYICENNQYGMGTDFRRVSAVQDFSVLAGSYDIPGVQVNGMDFLQVHDAVGEMLAKVRSDKRPALMEIRTYRYMGHSMSDPAKYRSRDEVAERRKEDPILLLRHQMTEAGLLDDETFEGWDKDCRAVVEQAVKFADSSAQPALETRFEDVLA